MQGATYSAAMRSRLMQRLELIPVDKAVTLPSTVWMQHHALEYMSLGFCAMLPRFTREEREALLDAVATLQGPTGSSTRRSFVDPVLDSNPFSVPDQPFLDAALSIAVAEGLEALTLERIGRKVGRTTSFMISAFGTIEKFWKDALSVALEEGLDDVLPRRGEVDEHSVEQSIAILLDSRQFAAHNRVLVLTGVRLGDADRAQFRAVHQQNVQELPAITASAETWLLPLALEGWRLGGVMYDPTAPRGVSAETRSRLRGLILR